MEQRELSLAVVGINYDNEDRGKTSRLLEVEQCAPGEPVELRRQPKNEHDENAVAVFSVRGIQLGYLTAERAPWIGAKMAAEEYEVVFQGMAPTCAYIRIRFGGGAPTLPPQRDRPPTIRAAEDFYPDPEGPEWGA